MIKDRVENSRMLRLRKFSIMMCSRKIQSMLYFLFCHFEYLWSYNKSTGLSKILLSFLTLFLYISKYLGKYPSGVNISTRDEPSYGQQKMMWNQNEIWPMVFGLSPWQMIKWIGSAGLFCALTHCVKLCWQISNSIFWCLLRSMVSKTKGSIVY